VPRFAPLLLLIGPALAAAQGAAVSAADDAFGTSVGRESIGLYSASSVRGFSPTAAGNVRIEGLYFDQVWNLPQRLRGAQAIRVGLSAQGQAFPAPTGVVDVRLRRPGERASVDLAVGGDAWGGRYVELDGSRPLGAGWSVQGGVQATHTEYGNGTDANNTTAALALRWRPDTHTDATVFWARTDTTHDQIGPLLQPGYAGLPPFSPPRQFQGPSWAAYQGVGLNRGLLLRHALDPAWTLRLGLFHSEFDDRASFANLMLDLQPDGTGLRRVIKDPPSKVASDSGELRLTRHWADGDWQHRLSLQASGRSRTRLVGGSQSLDYGRMALDVPFEPTQPSWVFGERTHDRVLQHSGGLAYGLQWARQVEASVALQRSDYRKTVQSPSASGTPRAATASQPWLPMANGAWHLSPTLAVYAGFTQGMEESGVAPANASNRNQAMPALQTTQRDAGLRWQATPGLKLVAGVFDVRKPYYNLDAANLFTELGEVRHRGVELSLSGALTPEWQLVTGAVLMRPRVSGEAVRLGRVGERPVGQAERSGRLNLVWRPAALGGAAFDLGLAHTGPITATRDNRVNLPALTELDLGARWTFQLGPQAFTARVLMTNALNHRSFELRGSGLYVERPGRLLQASLSAAL